MKPNTSGSMDKKPSWEDIPSLGLSLEDSTSEKDIDRRKAVRLISQDIISMLMNDAKNIYVQVATKNGILKKKGVLQDINQGGMCFLMVAHDIQRNAPIQIGAMLGNRRFKTHADVRWVSKDKIGIEYVAPKTDDTKFLSGLYASKMLNHI